MTWLITLLLLIGLPSSVQAETIPQASDVVLIYNNASEEQQAKYNFIYTVNDDNTIYTCEANRCSILPVRDRGTVIMTVYKLPEGFPRVNTEVDQNKLAQYKQQAEQTYVLNSIVTNLSTSGETRPYQLVHLTPDGQATIDNATYTKPDINVPKDNATPSTNKGLWWKVLLGIISVGLVGTGGYYGWQKYSMRRRLQF